MIKFACRYLGARPDVRVILLLRARRRVDRAALLPESQDSTMICGVGGNISVFLYTMNVFNTLVKDTTWKS
jgi:hypothetical protein